MNIYVLTHDDEVEYEGIDTAVIGVFDTLARAKSSAKQKYGITKWSRSLPTILCHYKPGHYGRSETVYIERMVMNEAVDDESH